MYLSLNYPGPQVPKYYDNEWIKPSYYVLYKIRMNVSTCWDYDLYFLLNKQFLYNSIPLGLTDNNNYYNHKSVSNLRVT